jgi:hypothetical protein
MVFIDAATYEFYINYINTLSLPPYEGERVTTPQTVSYPLSGNTAERESKSV